jgi:hypothetical protein
MGLGLEGAYGVQGGWDALHSIIAERKKDELLAQKAQEQRARQELEWRKFEEDKRQFGLTNERLAEAAGIVRKRQEEQDIISKAGRIESSSAIGDPLTPDKIVALQQAGVGNAIKTQPILPGVGLIQKIGEKPTLQPGTPEVTGGGFEYGGTSQQVHQAEVERRAEQNAIEAQKRADAAAARGDKSLSLSEQRLALAEANANRPMPLVMIGNDGKPIVIGEAAHGSRVVPNPEKLLASDQQMKNAAKQVLPHIQEIRNMADQLNQRGLIGPVGSRWGDFVAGKIGSGELAAGDAEGAKLLGRFRSELKLLQSASARAHAGARGAGSESLLKAMEQVIAGGTDMPTFMGSLDGLQSFMEGYSRLGEPIEEGGPTPRSPAATPGPGLRGGPKAAGAAPAGGGGGITIDANGRIVQRP